MCDGGVLGFTTQYSYTFDVQWANLLANATFTRGKNEIIVKLQQYPFQQFVNKSPAEQELDLKKVGITGADVNTIIRVVSSSSYHPRFKGADHVIFSSAKLLGLPVHVKPMLKSVSDGYYGYYYPYRGIDDVKKSQGLH